jgi:hypothetical protein
MNRAVQEQTVTEAQKIAVRALIDQTRAAVARQPQLNTPELHKATTELIRRTYGEN